MDSSPAGEGNLPKAWKFGDDIDTDAIIPGRYLVMNDPLDLAKHAFEGIRSQFAGQVEPGDVIVAGSNFGCGSSREHAPLALKGAGVKAVVSRSYARIFFRNSINVGLPLLVCDEVDRIRDGDRLSLDLDRGIIHNLDRLEDYNTTPLPPFLQEIVEAGGLIQYTKRQVGTA